MHAAKLSQDFFPIVAQVPKRFNGRNRRHLDVNVARYESDKKMEIDRTGWGLPEPNREAAYTSLAKYAKSVEILSHKQVLALNMAAQWMRREFGPYMQNSKVRGQEEVVAKLEKSTSNGYPWVRKYPTKRDMIDNWQGFEVYMSEDWDRLKEENYTAVFGNSLKEEIRAAEKIAENSIRTFTAGPIEMTIHGNRLFEDMNEKFYASHLKTASVVGFSPLKGGWNALYRKLKKFQNGFALDESQYDSSLRSYLMWACAEFRWEMLSAEDRTPDNLMRLRVYYRNLVNTLIITSDGVFVMKKGGNPSGSVNTIVDNTLILYMLMAYGWIMVSPISQCTYSSFSDNLSLALVGDDNTWTVSDSALEFFNARTLIAEWKLLGVTTTTDSLDPRPVEELDFLSAHTVFIDGIAVPLYDRNKLLTSLLYSLHPEDPAYTLTRAAGLLQIGWTDEHFRVYLQELIGWLVDEYSDVLHENGEWKLAMRQLKSDEELRKLFVGEEIPIFNQSYNNTECRERLESGIKSSHTNCLTGPTYDSGCEMLALPQRAKRQRKPKGPPPLPSRKTVAYDIARATEQIIAKGKKGNQSKNQKKRQQRQNLGLPRQRGARPGRAMQRGFVEYGMGGPTQARSMDMRVTAGGQTLQGSRLQVIEQDEFIAAILGTNSATPTVTAFPINPGQAGTFPWLAKVALLFEKYHFEYLEFYYKTRTSQFQTQGQGAVVLCCDYDAADSPPITLQQALDMDPHVDDVPYEQLRLFLSPPDLMDGGGRKGKYVRPNGLPGGTDIKTYDAGNLFVVTVNNGSTAELGELRVRYKCRLQIPVLEDIAAAPVNNQVAVFQSTGEAPGVSGVAKNILLATQKANGLGAVNTAGSIVLPAGNYLVDFDATVTDSVDDITGFVADIQVASVSTYAGLAPIILLEAAGTALDLSLHASAFVSVNGTQALTFPLIVAYTGGTVLVYGSVRITSV